MCVSQCGRIADCDAPTRLELSPRWGIFLSPLTWKRQMELVSRAQVYVVIPAYNEGTVLSRVVSDVRRAGYAVVVVDDGSIDATADRAHAAGAARGESIRSISAKAPRCKPASILRSGGSGRDWSPSTPTGSTARRHRRSGRGLCGTTAPILPSAVDFSAAVAMSRRAPHVAQGGHLVHTADDGAAGSPTRITDCAP